MRIASLLNIGKREQMEDTLTLIPDFVGFKDWVFGGVYDGHGGTAQVSEFLRDTLYRFVQEGLIKGVRPDQVFEMTYEFVQKMIKAMNLERGGACAANFLLQSNVLSVANVGDCQIVVIDKQIKNVKRLTVDHRMTNDQEFARMIESGAVVEDEIYYRPGKGQPGLMVSRAFGDASLKSVGLIATPDTGTYKLSPDDRWILAGTDGLFDYVSDQQILDIFSSEMSPDELLGHLDDNVCIRTVMNAEARDNIATILVDVL